MMLPNELIWVMGKLAIHPNSTPDDPSVGGTWGDFSKFVFGSKQASG